MSAILAEFDNEAACVAAIEKMRDKGYRNLEAYTPYPSHDIEHALHLERSKIPFIAFGGMLIGGSGAYFLQWYLNGYDYPLNVGGRPAHMTSAFLIITFEMCVLFTALTTFFGVLWKAKMPSLWRPVFEVEGFESATLDKFWLAVSYADPRYDADGTSRELTELGALRIGRTPAEGGAA